MSKALHPNNPGQISLIKFTSASLKKSISKPRSNISSEQGMRNTDRMAINQDHYLSLTFPASQPGGRLKTPDQCSPHPRRTYRNYLQLLVGIKIDHAANCKSQC